MKVEKLTTMNVASHLRKYRLHLKKISHTFKPNQEGSVHFNGINVATAVQNVSLPPFNDVFDPNSTNSIFNGKCDIDFSEWINGDGVVELREENSSLMEEQQGFVGNQQHKYQSTCMGNNLGAVQHLVTSSFSWSSHEEEPSIAELREVSPPSLNDVFDPNSTNSIFNGNWDIDFSEWINGDAVVELREENSSLMEEHQGFCNQQHKSQSTCMANNPGLVHDLVTSSSSWSSHEEEPGIAELRQVSPPPLNDVCDPNSFFNEKCDINFSKWINGHRVVELREENSSLMEEQQGFFGNQQHKSQSTCMANNPGLVHDLVTSSSSWSTHEGEPSIAELRQVSPPPLNDVFDPDINFSEWINGDGVVELREENSSLMEEQQEFFGNQQPKSHKEQSSVRHENHEEEPGIAELRQEVVAVRHENRQLWEIVKAIKAKQDLLMHAISQRTIVPPNMLTEQ